MTTTTGEGYKNSVLSKSANSLTHGANFKTKVLPLETKDQWNPVANIRILDFFVVRNILDSESLKRALTELIQDHIPILGARLTGSKVGSLKYVLPDGIEDGNWPEDYPLFTWSESSISTTLAESKLLVNTSDGSPDTVVRFGPSVIDIENAWCPESWPRDRKVEEPLSQPMLLVHLTFYTDATIVAVNIPHAVCDQGGISAVMHAWLDLVAGKQPMKFAEPEPGAFDSQVFDKAKHAKVKYQYRIHSTLGGIFALVPLAVEVMKDQEEIRRTMWLNSKRIEELRDRINKKLKEEAKGDVPYVTSGDVVAGIVIKFSNMHRKEEKPISVNGPINSKITPFFKSDDFTHRYADLSVPFLRSWTTSIITSR